MVSPVSRTRTVLGIVLSVVTGVVVYRVIQWLQDMNTGSPASENQATEEHQSVSVDGMSLADAAGVEDTDKVQSSQAEPAVLSSQEAGPAGDPPRGEKTNTVNGEGNSKRSEKIQAEMGQSVAKKLKSSLFPQSLEDFGYHFNEDGELRDIKTGERFEFNYYPDHGANQARYEDLGKVVDEFVYSLLDNEGLQRVPIPVTAKPNDAQGFFFMSEDAVNKDKLLVLIHGSGVVRAGQWARRLIINNDLHCGTQLPFIKKAIELGYGVVVMNTNQNYGEKRRPIRGSGSPEEHGSYVWQNFVQRGSCQHIAIVAHSYGGVVVGSLAKLFFEDFISRVFAVAFTDSFGYQFGKKSPLHDYFKMSSVNWVSSDMPLDTPVTSHGGDFPMRSAGHTKHEWTSWSSFQSIFKFFEQRYASVTSQTEQQPAEQESETMAMTPDESGDGAHADLTTQTEQQPTEQESETMAMTPDETGDEAHADLTTQTELQPTEQESETMAMTPDETGDGELEKD